MRTTAREREAVRAAVRSLGWEPCELRFATGFFERLRGLMGAVGQGRACNPAVLVFPRCSSVHTCFMPCAIDVAFIAKDGTVLTYYERVPPWRLLRHADAWAVLEQISIARRPSKRNSDLLLTADSVSVY